jgi:ElaB/YqjD/DUF883 family membrane-anchored ribosome-binding protein
VATAAAVTTATATGAVETNRFLGFRNLSTICDTDEATPTGAAGDATRKRRRRTRLFLDEHTSVFARRLSFSPDGELLVVSCALLPPALRTDAMADDAAGNAAAVFTRASLQQTGQPSPALYLTGPIEPVIGVRFAPHLWQRRPMPAAAVPSTLCDAADRQYRMVFALITLDEVLVYDTQHPYPLCSVKNIHFAPLTDVSWSSDARALFVTSTDGYISALTFDVDALGSMLPADAQRDIMAPLEAHTTNVEMLFKASATPAKKAKAKTKSKGDDGGDEKKKRKHKKKKKHKKKTHTHRQHKKDKEGDEPRAMQMPITAFASSSSTEAATPTKKRRIVPTPVASQLKRIAPTPVKLDKMRDDPQ